MNPSFGPWSTAIGPGKHPELSAFWKQRVALLPIVSQAAATPTWPDLLRLAGVVIVLALLPLLRPNKHAVANDGVAKWNVELENQLPEGIPRLPEPLSGIAVDLGPFAEHFKVAAIRYFEVGEFRTPEPAQREVREEVLEWTLKTTEAISGISLYRLLAGPLPEASFRAIADGEEIELDVRGQRCFLGHDGRWLWKKGPDLTQGDTLTLWTPLGNQGSARLRHAGATKVVFKAPFRHPEPLDHIVVDAGIFSEHFIVVDAAYFEAGAYQVPDGSGQIIAEEVLQWQLEARRTVSGATLDAIFSEPLPQVRFLSRRNGAEVDADAREQGYRLRHGGRWIGENRPNLKRGDRLRVWTALGKEGTAGLWKSRASKVTFTKEQQP